MTMVSGITAVGTTTMVIGLTAVGTTTTVNGLTEVGLTMAGNSHHLMVNAPFLAQKLNGLIL